MVAAALAYAKTTGKTVAIHKAGGRNPHVKNTQKYVTSIFSSIRTLDYLPDKFTPSFKLFEQAGPFSKWDPADSSSDSKNVILSGYFQYFPALQPFEQDILAELKKNLPERAPRKNVVGIHVRRGDYISIGYVITPMKYFAEAMAYMREHVDAPAPTFLVFTNDLTWCKQQPEFSGCAFSGEEDDVKCLADMVSCKLGFISSNSTYSWWGAFLGAHAANGLVCAPSTWVHKDWVKPLDGTLYPPTWKIIMDGL